MSRAFNWIRHFRLQGSVLLVLVVLWIVFLIGSPKAFLSFPIYGAFMSTIPMSAIMSLAMTLVIISGEIDLSFPAVMGFCGWVFVTVCSATGNIYHAFLASLATGLFAGAVNGLIVTRLGIPSLITTIGMQFFWRGLTNICAHGRGRAIVEAKTTILHSLFVGRVAGLIPAQILWTVVLAFTLWLFLNRHKRGAHIYYVGDNIDSARMMGIRVDWVKFVVFMQMGFFASFAGILASLEVSYLWPSMGEGYLLRTLAAVFIGGTSVFGGMGTIFGTFIGALIIGSLEGGIVAIGLTGFWTQLIYGLIIVVSLSIWSYFRHKE